MLTFKHKDSRGSIMVDAACSLPIFIIAFGIMLMLIAQAGIEDTVFRAMTVASEDVAATLAGKSTILEIAGDDSADEASLNKVTAYAAFSLGLKDALSDEWAGDTPLVRLSGMDVGLEHELESGTGLDNLISAHVTVATTIPVVSSFRGLNYAGRSLVFRPWVGESDPGEGFDDTRVYVFPKRGEHYHCSSCSCLKNGEIQVVLSEKIRKRYSGCSTCRAGELPDGAAVFLMSSGSKAFHRKSCPCITKAYECTTVSEAKAMGYSACGLCGGTSENYSPYTDFFK